MAGWPPYRATPEGGALMPDDGRPKQRSDQEPDVPKRAAVFRAAAAVVLAAVCFLLVWYIFVGGWRP